MGNLVDPHGGKLNPLLANQAEREELAAKAKTLKSVTLDSLEASDLLMLATGAFSPLGGFMNQADYTRVVADMRLDGGTLWPIPAILSVPHKTTAAIKIGEEIALMDAKGNTLALMRVEDKFQPDIKKEALNVFKTTDTAHPGVAQLFSRQGICLGGSVRVLSEGDYRERFPEYAAPAETRRIFYERGWHTITAFQTRNPLHRSHEYLTKVALEISDGLLIHPIVGKLKLGDIPAEVRMKCYRAVLDRYYPADRVVLKVYPMEMRYAGPREAVLHAIIRQNFGCSHMIVGRDHAGVGDYYGTFDAQNIFDTLAPDDLHITPIKFEHVFWCRTCGAMASVKTCPHPPEEHLFISGAKLRGMFAKGETPPPQIARPEVVEILIDYYRGLNE